MEGKTSVKKRYAFLLGCLILLIIFIVAAAVLVKSLFTSEELTSRIVSKMEAALKREVEIDGIGLAVFFWGVGVKVEGVRIANLEEFGPEPLAGFEEFLLKVKFLPLLKRRLEITKIVLVKPYMNLVLTRDGKSNISDLLMSRSSPPEKSKIASMAILLPVLQIEDGQIHYTDEKSQASVLVEHIDQWIHFEADRSFRNVRSSGKATFGGITFTAPKVLKRPIPGIQVSLEHTANLNLADEQAELEEVKLELPFAIMNLRGEISNFKTVPSFKLTVNSDRIDLNQVLASLPTDVHPFLKKVALTGWMELGTDVLGDTGNPTIRGRLLVKEVEIRHTDISQPIGIMADIDFTENTIDVTNFQAAVGGNSVRLNVNLKDFNEPILNARMESNVNLEEIGGLYSLSPGIAMSGKVSAEVSAGGRISTPEALRIDGQVNVVKAAVTLPHVTKPLENMQGKITFTQNSVDDLKMSVSWGRSDLNLSGKVTDLRTLLLGSGKKPRASLVFTSNLLDVDEILPPPERKEKDDSDKPGQTPVFPLPDIGADIRFQGKSMRWRAMDMADVSLQLTLQDQMATLQEFKANVYGGTMNLSGQVDFNNAERPVFSVKTRIDKVETNTFLSRFSSFGRHLFGKFTTSITLEGKGGDAEAIKRSLNGSGGLAISEGKLTNWTLLQSLSKWTNLPSLEEMRFKDWQGSFFILNQRVKTEDLKIHGEDADWIVSGSTGFDGSLDYTVDALLSPSLSQKVSAGSFGGLTGLLKDEQGRVNLMFRVSGKPSRPKFEWDTERAREKAEERLASEAEKLRQEIEGKLQDEKTKLEEEARKKADELKKKAEEERKKKEEELKKKAQEALKKLFKPGP